MFYELLRRPDVISALRDEQTQALGGEAPDARVLMSGELQLLEMVQDETLRMYPPAWIGARKAIDTFEFAGATVPGGAYVNCSSVGLSPPSPRVRRSDGVPPRALRAG